MAIECVNSQEHKHLHESVLHLYGVSGPFAEAGVYLAEDAGRENVEGEGGKEWMSGR